MCHITQEVRHLHTWMCATVPQIVVGMHGDQAHRAVGLVVWAGGAGMWPRIGMRKISRWQDAPASGKRPESAGDGPPQLPDAFLSLEHPVVQTTSPPTSVSYYSAVPRGGAACLRYCPCLMRTLGATGNNVKQRAGVRGDL